MKYEIETYTAYYPPPDGEGEYCPDKPDEWSEIHQFDHLVEVAEWLRNNGITYPSVSPLNTWNGHAWLYAETYEDPYTGVREEVTAHRVTGDGFTDREWLALLHSVQKTG